MTRPIAILNCYSPDGANIAQVTMRSDGSHGFTGDESIARAVLALFRKIPGKRVRPAIASQRLILQPE